MIDFENGSVIKLCQVDESEVTEDIMPVLTNGEHILGAYRSVRDYCVFTDKRIISVNVQGVTGRKRAYTSLPYKKVSIYAVETAGIVDIDGELELVFSGVGSVKFEFTGGSDIKQICQVMSEYIL